jgi:hypothetical protein
MPPAATLRSDSSSLLRFVVHWSTAVHVLTFALQPLTLVIDLALQYVNKHVHFKVSCVVSLYRTVAQFSV